MSGLQKAVDMMELGERLLLSDACLVPKRLGGLWFLASEPGL